MDKELVIVLDFGGQYNQLIARRVRELSVYSEMVPYDISYEELVAKKPKAVILTGGPASVHMEGAPVCDERIFEMGIPILGICYGMQLMAYKLGGAVESSSVREYGRTMLELEDDLLFKGVDSKTQVWMSHGISITRVPEGFEVIAHTPSCPIAAIKDSRRNLYGVQFHPEVKHSLQGQQVLSNFLFEVCGLKGDWNLSDFINSTVQGIREKVGDRKVLCAMSGGVDSSVAATLVNKAIGSQLTCVYVDNGLMRKNESQQVIETFRDRFGMNLVFADAGERFLAKLAGVTDPERKRKIIGEEFIRVFEEEARKLGQVDFLVQGTIYPDIVESGTKTAQTIKSHHNVGGLPKDMKFSLIEPLRLLFKDEVRVIGEKLGIPHEIVWRQPFPGPGLAVRCIGAITTERLAILREADAIFREEIAKAGLERDINQYFAVITDMRSVGVMGDTRTYDYTIALRAVTTTDFMTADWARIPLDVLGAVSTRIVNEVKGVNRIVYDITSKPPATIEWE